jgi:hypothetical protein
MAMISPNVMAVDYFSGVKESMSKLSAWIFPQYYEFEFTNDGVFISLYIQEKVNTLTINMAGPDSAWALIS